MMIIKELFGNLSNLAYLGDAVYAGYDGYHIVLMVSNGTSVTNRICLDPGVISELSNYVDRLNKVKGE